LNSNPPLIIYPLDKNSLDWIKLCRLGPSKEVKITKLNVLHLLEQSRFSSITKGQGIDHAREGSAKR
jgi:hypothetical protein